MGWEISIILYTYITALDSILTSPTANLLSYYLCSLVLSFIITVLLNFFIVLIVDLLRCCKRSQNAKEKNCR